MSIPRAYAAQCSFCTDELDTRALGVFRLYFGWAEKRAQGGTNTIALAQPRDRWAHKRCVDERRQGLSGPGFQAQPLAFENLGVDEPTW